MYIDKRAILTFETNGNKDKNPFPWLCWCTEVVTNNICMDFFFCFLLSCNLIPSRWKNRYILGIMIKLRKASTITKPMIRSTFVSGSRLIMCTYRQTRQVINSNDQENAVFWRLTVYVLLRLILDDSDIALMRDFLLLHL